MYKPHYLRKAAAHGDRPLGIPCVGYKQYLCHFEPSVRVHYTLCSAWGPLCPAQQKRVNNTYLMTSSSSSKLFILSVLRLITNKIFDISNILQTSITPSTRAESGKSSMWGQGIQQEKAAPALGSVLSRTGAKQSRLPLKNHITTVSFQTAH